MSLIKVAGHDNLSKDAQTGGVVNTDKEGFRLAKLAKAKILADKEKLDTLEQRVAELEKLFKRIAGDIDGTTS